MGTFTMATGLGMLAIGMVVIAILGAGFLYVIRTQEKIRKEDQLKKEREKIYGSN
tara:strand:+ start:85 stop:249 length:165 start_codon:yes stop_codon:yes gene_type:complete